MMNKIKIMKRLKKRKYEKGRSMAIEEKTIRIENRKTIKNTQKRKNNGIEEWNLGKKIGR